MYSWKSRPSPPRDLRLNADGSPLRVVAELGSVNRHLDQLKLRHRHHDYLCEAQISLFLNATNKSHWTGYCFEDTYHLAESHEGDGLSGGLGGELDPTSCRGAKPSKQSPREYFLFALDRQLQVFQREWRHTVNSLNSRVKEHVR